MAFSRACFNILFLVQDKVSLPIKLTSNGPFLLKTVYNPNHICSPDRIIPISHAKLLWKFFKYVLVFLKIFTFFRIIWLFSNWKQSKEFEQTTYYFLFGAIINIGYQAVDLIDTHVEDICFLFNHKFQTFYYQFCCMYFLNQNNQ